MNTKKEIPYKIYLALYQNIGFELTSNDEEDEVELALML